MDKNNWVPDSEAKSCHECKKGFGITVRKHHCRACGNVFCKKCTGGKTVLAQGPGHAQRVCNGCLSKSLQSDNIKFEEQKKLDVKKRNKEKADTDYVTNIYDREGLVGQIIQFLQGGCKVHIAENGERVPAKMWLQASPDSLRWCYTGTQPSGTQPRSQTFGVNISVIKPLRLGHTKELKSIQRLTKEEQMLCVTIPFSEAEQKSGATSVSIICREVVDFEAWVLGLSHVKRNEPTWDQPFKLEKSLLKAGLTNNEAQALANNCIPASVFVTARDKIMARTKEVKHHLWVHDGDQEKAWQATGIRPYLSSREALYATKGEIRHYTDLDIFRACKLWEVMASQHLIFDPKYRPAVGRGSEESKSKELRIDSDGNAYSKEVCD